MSREADNGLHIPTEHHIRRYGRRGDHVRYTSTYSMTVTGVYLCTVTTASKSLKYSELPMDFTQEKISPEISLNLPSRVQFRVHFFVRTKKSRAKYLFPKYCTDPLSFSGNVD